MELVDTNGTKLAVRVQGDGPAIVFLHGWPHTGAIWDPLVPLLPGRRLIAPDLRGIGASAPAAAGFDAGTGADDVLGLLSSLGIDRATVVAIDAGVPPAFLLAARHPARVSRLVLMEATLPGLPGGFAQPPWWFGFHAIPDFPARVLAGHEEEYVAHFLPAFADAYAGRLDASLGTYREMARSGKLIAAAGRLTVPTVAIGGSVVGGLLHEQLRPLADDLRGEILERCGHLVPVDRPDALAAILNE